MLLNRIWECRTQVLALGLAVLLPALPAVAQEEPDSLPDTSEELGTPPDSETPTEETLPAQVIRRLSLAGLGFEKGVVLEGQGAERELRFPLPRGLAVEQAGLALSFDYNMALSETASLRVDVDGVPRAAEVLSGQGQLDLPLPVAGPAHHEDQVSLKLSYRAARSGDRCLDERTLPDFAHLRPESGLHLAVDAHQIDSLAAAWALLPQRVTLSLGHAPLSPDNFAALLELSRRLLASGRDLRYLPLPEIPDDAPVGLLAAGLSGARSLLFTGDSEDERFAIGHLLVAADEELLALEEAVEAAQIRFRRFSGADEGEIPTAETRLQPAQDQQQPMRLLRFLDYPVIAAGGSDPAATAAFLGSELAPLATGPELDVSNARFQVLEASARDSVTFAQLGFERFLRVGPDRSVWSLDFDLRDLPNHRLPSSLELQLVLPESAEGRLSDPLDVYFNEVLLATLAPGRSGQRRREVISLPAHLLASSNRLSIELRRSSSDECYVPALGTPAQLLGSSLIRSGSETPQPRDFIEMIGHMGPEPLFLLPEALLQRAGEVMPLLASLTNTLLPDEARPQLRFYGERLPPIGRPFLLLGEPPDRVPQAPLIRREDRLEMRSGTGELLLEAAARDQAAVLQLARIGDWTGFWLLPDGQGDYPAVPARLLLDRSNVAWLDDRGIALALQSDREAARQVRFPWAERWLEQLEGQRQALLIGAAVLAILVLLLLVARARGKRRRRAARTGLERRARD